MDARLVPRLFLVASRPRALLLLAALTLLSGAAMLPAMATMGGHGASLIVFESAGSVARSREILADWGQAGKTAMWWQLALDLPFLIGYGLFLAGACTAVAYRAARVGKPRLARVASGIAWLGPFAAFLDFLQNVSLALVLAGHVAQPWSRISALADLLTTPCTLTAALFAVVGTMVTRGGSPRVEPDGRTG